MSWLSDFGDALSGEPLYNLAGDVWDKMLKVSSKILLQNPTGKKYSDVWDLVGNVNTLFVSVATSLTVLFFLYGFLRDSVDIKQEMSFSSTIKEFIRLVIAVNVIASAFSWISSFAKWGKKGAGAILGISESNYYGFDGEAIHDAVTDSAGTAIIGLLLGFLFFLFTAACGVLILFTVLKRMIYVYMLAPFCALALSTLAAGGQTSQVGFSYIRTLLGHIFSALLIALAFLISGTFVSDVVIKGNGIIVYVSALARVMSVTMAVKGTDTLMQKAFNL